MSGELETQNKRTIQAVCDELIEHRRVIEVLNVKQILRISEVVFECLNRNGQVLFCGNGGSASQAQHFAAELVCKYKMNRRAFASISLTTDTSIITAQANDTGYDTVFERQVEALCNKGDVLIALSTSGESRNVIKAAKKAKIIGAKVIAFVGKNKENELSRIADVVLSVESTDTPRIQEAHLTAGHIMCGIVERRLVSKS